MPPLPVLEATNWRDDEPSTSDASSVLFSRTRSPGGDSMTTVTATEELD